MLRLFDDWIDFGRVDLLTAVMLVVYTSASCRQFLLVLVSHPCWNCLGLLHTSQLLCPAPKDVNPSPSVSRRTRTLYRQG